jgi:hypothetical protein
MKTVHTAVSRGAKARQITLESLPALTGTRWSIRRKTDVVMAVLDGVLSFDDACRRYAMSAEEFLSWQDLVTRRSLKATYRPRGARGSAAEAHSHRALLEARA